MLANRKFAIPLIVLLAFCLVGLILVGIVLILKPGSTDANGTAVAGMTSTSEQQEVSTEVVPTEEPTDVPTPRPTPTLVPLGTSVDSAAGDEDATPTTAATAEPTASPSPQATSIPITDEELADTGIGWGLVLFAGIGLALLAVAARRLRMA